jgi:hypothetical protein
MLIDGARRRRWTEAGLRAPRRRPPRWGGSRVVVPVGLLVAASVTVAVVAFASPAGGGRYQLATQVAPPRLEAAVRPTPKRILIFGDSIAAQAGGHAQRALEEVGVEVKVVGLWGQSMFTRDQYDMGATNPHPPEGTVMAAAEAAVADFRPDVVAVSLNHNYWPPFPRDASGADIVRGSPAFAAMARTQLTELVHRLTVSDAKVYLVDPIPERAHETAAQNAIWTAYMSVQQQLGFDVIAAGDRVAGPDGGRVEEMPDCRGHDTRVRPADDIHLTYLGAGLVGTELARQLADAVGVPAGGIEAPAEAPVALVPMGTGYRLVTCDGGTFRFGSGGEPLAPPAGSQDTSERAAAERAAAELSLTGEAGAPARGRGADPVVGAAATNDGRGAWEVTATGRVRGLGRATGGELRLAEGDRAVGIAADPDGTGYWVATANGHVHAMGGAPAAGGLDTGEEVVAITAAPDGGYWLLTVAGRVAGFAGAPDLGGLGRDGAAGGVVGLAARPGGGYWILDRAGGVHPFGAAGAFGSAADQPLARITRFASTGDFDSVPVPPSEVPTEAVSILSTPTGEGYWVAMANGAVCSFGDAPHIGGIHRSEVDQVLMLKGQEYYGDGPCRQDAGFGPPNTA